MKKAYIILSLFVIFALSGCVQNSPMVDDIGPLTYEYEEDNTSYLPASDARCELVDELEILRSFPLEAGEEGKYAPLDDEDSTITTVENEITTQEDLLENNILNHYNLQKYEIKTKEPLIGRIAYGKASWYGKKFHGNRTASGEQYDMYDKTAAHKQLPFNSLVKITDIETGKSEIVRINDRGPYHGDRIIDVSYATAKTLGLIRQGTCDVKLEILEIGFDPRCRPPLSK